LAFKPIQIGQSVFIDEGAGQYNPAPFVLDEACVNEWPGREVGVFVSIGTGKRPSGSDQNQHLWYEGFMGDFAEARRRLIAKIEGCEETHQYMMREGLSKRQVNIENYYRLNVEIGVGEFGMNEWNRLADISTGTRRYLGKSEVQRMNLDAAAKLAKIHRAKARFDKDSSGGIPGSSGGRESKYLQDVPEAYPMAVELPAEIPVQRARSPPPRPSYESGHHDTLEVPSHHKTPSPRSSNDNQSRPQEHRQSPNMGSPKVQDTDGDRLLIQNPTPSQYRNAGGADKIAIMSLDEFPKPKIEPPKQPQGRVDPPPLPPKTPIQEPALPMGRGRLPLPYPLDDGPPPAVNMARKPNYR
jgi:hypothetical protein